MNDALKNVSERAHPQDPAAQGSLPLFTSGAEAEQGKLLDLFDDEPKHSPAFRSEAIPVPEPPPPPLRMTKAEAAVPPPQVSEAKDELKAADKPERKVLKLTPATAQASPPIAPPPNAPPPPPEKKPVVLARKDPPPEKKDAPPPPSEKKEKKTTPPDPRAHARKPPPSRSEDSLGVLLLEARLKVGYSIEQVSGTTRINGNYIEALERDDYRSVPPAIYARAYVKKLCSLYGVSEEEGLKRLKFSDKSKQLVPDALLQTLEEHKQVNVEEETKVERTAWLLMSALVIGITICFCAGVILWQGYFKQPHKKAGVERTVDTKDISKEMERLIAPQQLPMSDLPFPE